MDVHESKLKKLNFFNRKAQLPTTGLFIAFDIIFIENEPWSLMN